MYYLTGMPQGDIFVVCDYEDFCGLNLIKLLGAYLGA